VREEELALLRRRWERARSGHGQLQKFVPPYQEGLALKTPTAFLSFALLAMTLTLIQDIAFMRNPPKIPIDKETLAECARPTGARTW
jgi:hypothetical protein